MLKNLLALLLAVPSTCFAASYHIALHYDPPAQAGTQQADTSAVPTAFVVQVADERDFVENGNKSPAYLGHYRSLAGVVWDVNNHDDTSLADQFQSDLGKDLRAMGLRTGDPGTALKVKVVIHGWNFNAYTNGRFSFDVEAEVDAPDGHALASSHVKGDRVIKGNFLTGPIGAMKRGVPAIYGEIVRKLVREDAGMVAALHGQK